MSTTLEENAVCRACMGNTNQMESLYLGVRNVGENILLLSQMFTECTSIKVFQDDKLTNKMCKPCIRILEVLYKFRHKCLIIDAKLRGDQHLDKNELNYYINDDIYDDLQAIIDNKDFDDHQLLQLNQKHLIVNNIDLKNKLIEHNEIAKNKTNIDDEEDDKVLEPSSIDNQQFINQILNDHSSTTPPHLDNTKVNDSNDEKDDCGSSSSSSEADTGQTKTYTCNYCNKIFDRRQLFKKHLQWHQIEPKDDAAHDRLLEMKVEDPKDFNCCGKLFKNSKSYWMHKREKHNRGSAQAKLAASNKTRSQTMYKCDYCLNRSFKSHDCWEAHMNMHQGLLAHECNICGKKFNSKKFLQAHSKRHETKGETEKQSDAESSDFDEFGNDFVSCDQVKSDLCNNNGVLECRTSGGGDVVEQHGGGVVDELKNQLKCKICYATFTSLINFKYHMNKHMGLFEYECDLCPKKFATALYLKNHKKKHMVNEQQTEGAVQHLCNICGRNYTTAYGLKCHMKYHNEERPHKCDQCPASFVHFRLLTAHKLRHAGEKNFLCYLCPKRFTTSSNLNDHIKRHKNHENMAQCQLCNTTLPGLKSLKNHMKTYHMDYTKHGNKRYPCKICDKLFVREVLLVAHMKTHTGEGQYQCNLCKKRFKHLGSIALHAPQCPGVPILDHIILDEQQQQNNQQTIINEQTNSSSNNNEQTNNNNNNQTSVIQNLKYPQYIPDHLNSLLNHNDINQYY